MLLIIVLQCKRRGCHMRQKKLFGSVLYSSILLTMQLSGIGAAQAYEVIIEGDQACGISNLEVSGALYNVEFVFKSADELYGETPVFDVSNESSAIRLVDAIAVALSNPGQGQAPPLTVGVCGSGMATTYFAIGFGEAADFVEVVDGSRLVEPADIWVNGGPDTRVDNVQESYASLSLADGSPPPTPPPPLALDYDVTGIVDIFGDTVPDIGYLTYRNAPVVRIYSGADGQKLKGVRYFNQTGLESEPWIGIAAATVADADSDGVPDDPAIAVLGLRADTRDIQVETRLVCCNSIVAPPITFFSFDTTWRPIDIAVIDDLNGDGVTGDTAVAVLATNDDPSDNIRVQIVRLADGITQTLLTFFDPDWRPIALEVSNRAGKNVLIGVLATKPENGNNKIEVRKLDGSTQLLQAVWDSNWRVRDIAVLKDMNGDGVADDQAWLVLAYNPNRGNKAQARMVSGGAWAKNLFFRGIQWYLTALATTDDISGNLVEEVAAMGKKPDERIVVIDLVDYATDTKTGTIVP